MSENRPLKIVTHMSNQEQLGLIQDMLGELYMKEFGFEVMLKKYRDRGIQIEEAIYDGKNVLGEK